MAPGEPDNSEGFLRGRWPGSWLGGVLLVILCLAVYLPGFFALPAVDRDEARFAQASRQMLESGDYTVPRVQDRPRLNKPPLIYWLQSTSARALTHDNPLIDAIWMYRVPSLLAAIVAVLATWRLGRSMFPGSPLIGWLAAASLAVCPVVAWEARQARADMVLVACTTVAMWMLWELWKGETERRRDEETNCTTGQDTGVPDYTQAPTSRVRLSVSTSVRLFFLWLATGAGVMTKGPVTPMVVFLGALTLAIAARRWRWIWRLQPILGLLLIAAMIGPWVWLVARQVGWDTYVTTIKDEVLGRSLEPKEGHAGFPGFHTLLMPFLLFPGSILIGTGLWTTARESLAAIRAARGAATLPTTADITSSPHQSLFLLSLLLPSWLVFELVGTKLPHYTMPLYPLLAIIAARAACVDRAAFAQLLKHRVVFSALAAWLMAIPAALVLAGLLLGVALGGLPKVLFATLAAAALAILFCLAAARIYRRRDMPALLLLGILAFAGATMFLTEAIPRFDDLWVSRDIARKLDALDPGHQRPIATVSLSGPISGYQEDSLTFETRARIQRVEDADLNLWFVRHPTGLAVVPADLKYMQKDIVILGAVEGFNYTKGRSVYLAIVELRH
jgi:4-amino-4-deoxy-L-arabinose transferase-like glycosyltransferase